MLKEQGGRVKIPETFTAARAPRSTVPKRNSIILGLMEALDLFDIFRKKVREFFSNFANGM